MYTGVLPPEEVGWPVEVKTDGTSVVIIDVNEPGVESACVSVDDTFP